MGVKKETSGYTHDKLIEFVSILSSFCLYRNISIAFAVESFK